MKRFIYKPKKVTRWNSTFVVYKLYRKSWFLFYIPSHMEFETKEDAERFCNEMN